MVYFLIFTDTESSYDNYSEDFFIGVFKTEEKAIETAQYYLKHVDGFCKYQCTYRIEKKEILDNSSKQTPTSVWFVQAWNVNEELDEVDVITSMCTLTKERAVMEMQRMKKKYERSEWCLENHTVDELYWKEGFVKF